MHKKIDVFYRGEYLHSTNSYKTCKEARQAVIDRISKPDGTNSWFAFKAQLNNINPRCFKAYFDHSRSGR